MAVYQCASNLELKSQTCLNADLSVKPETLLICLMAVLLSDLRS